MDNSKFIPKFATLLVFNECLSIKNDYFGKGKV
jgi:hypothetical protein